MALSEETINKLNQLQEEYNKSVYDTILKEAESKNPYKVGDILQDHCQTGRILASSIGININTWSYGISYKCERLTKRLKPYKCNEYTTIYLMNVEKSIKEK